MRMPCHVCVRFSRLATLCLIAAIPAAGVLAGEGGESIYRARCARCHGADGQGQPDEYEEPLQGDRSLESLTRFIDRNMPEDDPTSCVGEDARQVAEYIYRQFYSQEARMRRGLIPAPRVELARLTVPQFRNAVADLVGRFAPRPADHATGEDEPGLRAEYYRSEGMSKANERILQRVDPHIDFQFGVGSPAAGITADQFAIVWHGSLLATDTGWYEFRLSTENGARLYLNTDPAEGLAKLRDDSSLAGQSALIDAWVSSGQPRVAAARAFLLGGRRYPLRVEYFKYQDKSASIKLEWKPPHGVWGVLDRTYLVTSDSPRVFALETPFPADDRSLGYERGSSVSREWHAAAATAAVATAAEVVERLPVLVSSGNSTMDRETLLKDFVVRFGRAAYRRPLRAAEAEWLRQVPFAKANTPEKAVRLALVHLIVSPHFLYTDLPRSDAPPDQFSVAARLALALWDSIPDEILDRAAEEGKLSSQAEIEAQARRMVADPRARTKMQEFFRFWLEIDERDLAKDREMFPEFDEAVVADLRHSLELFADQVMWSDASDYRQLLLADYVLLNDRLRPFYGPGTFDPPGIEKSPHEGPAAADSWPTEFRPVVLSRNRHAGVLTHPYLLSALAYPNNTSPIHRGVFLTRKILGRHLNPPPEAVAFQEAEFSPELTMREKVTQLTREQACMSCHEVINPLGFALENFDAIGRWRTEDRNKPLDTRSQLVTAEGASLEVDNARDIAELAASSDSAQRAFIAQVFHHLVKQDSANYDANLADRLLVRFLEDEFNMRNLVVTIATWTAEDGPARAVSEESTP